MPVTPADLPHLARRFLGHLRARPLSPAEQLAAGRMLREPELSLFWGMARQDQRHSFDVAMAVVAAAPSDHELARAGLLHDVGKRHSTPGAIARSVATLIEMARLPLPPRYAAYRRHGPIGAAELEAAGAESIVVDFARHHPGPAPPGVDQGRWKILLDADRA